MTWQTVLQPVFESDFYKDLQQSVDREYAENKCFPPKENIFRALDLCDFHQVKVVVLGQDPYHDDLQANGLAFSVNNQVKTPPSLKNIYKELYQDLGIVRNQNELDDWAKQGILLLNSTLTVKAHAANSHQKLGWEKLTDFMIKTISDKKENIVFVLWGSFAQKKIGLIDTEKHFVISEVHPSPLSAYRGFFGSKPFSKINDYLISKNKKTIRWEEEVPTVLF